MLSLTKKLSILTSLLATLAIGAEYDMQENDMQDNGMQNYEMQEKDADTSYRAYCLREDELKGAYNAPARCDVDGSWDMFITGSFIYWEPREKGLDLALSNPADIQNANGHIVNMDFDYEPGFKVGLGFNLDHDDWIMFFEYTRLHMDNKKSVNEPTNGSLVANWRADQLATPTHATGKWSLDYDIIDLKIGRPCYQGKRLIINPFIGARGGWIDQKYNAKYTILDEVVPSDAKQDTWLIGPRAGIDTNWVFGYGFRVFGDLATSLSYQKFKNTHEDYNDTTPEELEVHTKNKIGFITPNLDIGVGLAWGSYFDCYNWHIDLSLGYDFKYFWNQNMMRSLVNKVSDHIDGPAGGLMLHGLTITARLDF